MELSVHNNRLIIRLLKKSKNKFEVEVNGNSSSLPVHYDNGRVSVHVIQSGSILKLSTSFGLTVDWDGNNRGDVSLCDSYANYVCGLCGNGNGNFVFYV